MINKFRLLCLILLFGFAIIPVQVKAQVPLGLESRLVRVESENRQLRSQISRIESQLNQLQGRTSSPPNLSTPVRPPTSQTVPYRGSTSTLSSDPLFQRLSTLVIELKERIQALEAQIAQSRGQRKP
jgi:chaperonin cofactor prefoldin